MYGLFAGPPAYIARTPWTPGRATLATFAIIAAGLVGAAAIVGFEPTESPLRLPWRRSENIIVLSWLAIWQVIAVVLTIAAGMLFGGRARDVLALRAPPGGPKMYASAVLLMAGLQIALSVVQRALVADDMFADVRPFVRFIGGPEWPLALLVVGVGAPLSEELLFRGFLLSALAGSRLGFFGAAVLTSALWTALHAGYSAAGILEVFMIGLFFSWLLWRTGSLRVPIFCHALYNCLLVGLLRFVPLP
jgi:membrane protease YdiL (CAAX protease family)